MTEAHVAVVRERGGDVEIVRARVRDPGPGELLVRVVASGVCPTDLFGIDGGAGDRFPAVFGHEGAGVVEAVGPDVDDVRPGDHVVLGFDACGECRACRDGHPSACVEFAARNHGRREDLALDDGGSARGGWMAQSAWATRTVVNATATVVVPPDVPGEVAATLGCGVLTGAGTVLNVLAPGPGDALLVVGGGTTGLAAVMAARHRGVGRIVVSEPRADRRLLARELGATEVVAPGEPLPRDAMSHALDTVGSVETTRDVLGALAPGGTAATVALKPGANEVPIAQSRLLWSRTLRGVIEGDAVLRRDVPRLVAMWRAGALPVERLIAAYPFDEASAAVAAARRGDAVKAVLHVDDVPAARPAASRPDLLAALRAGAVPDAELEALWGTLPPVRPDELRGLWRGWPVTARHRTRGLLDRSGWYGKLFRSDDDVAPLVCRDAGGGLRVDRPLARGGAALRVVEHAGVRTAAMLYDGMPVIDLFVRLGPDAVLGIMTGRDTRDDGIPFVFVLEADPEHEGDVVAD